jgi:hypothetical protein
MVPLRSGTHGLTYTPVPNAKTSGTAGTILDTTLLDGATLTALTRHVSGPLGLDDLDWSPRMHD